MTAAFTVEQVDRRRVGRRRITFFTLVFLFTSLANIRYLCGTERMLCDTVWIFYTDQSPALVFDVLEMKCFKYKCDEFVNHRSRQKQAV